MTRDANLCGVPTVATCETLNDLLKKILEAGEIVAWCRRHGISRSSLNRARNGERRCTTGTILVLSRALHMKFERVKAAIEASRGD